jgi:long-chain acyl-CoA synthetase
MLTLPQFFEKSVENFPDNIYLWENKGGGYFGTTYRETRELVHRFAAGLLSLGVKKGDRFCLMSEGRNAWVVSELGILYAGGINVPLSTRLSEPEELRFRLEHSGTRIAIVSGRQADKIRGIKAMLPSLWRLIILDEEYVKSPDELSLNQVIQAGEDYLEVNNQLFENMWNAVTPHDEANICYTSGTSADPKGVVLTHRNYITNIQQAYSLMDLSENSCSLLTLSWDHAFTHTAGLYCFMGKGASIASVQQGSTIMETLRNIPRNMKEMQPNILFSVPAMAANFKKKIESEIRSKGKFTEILFHHALKIAYMYNGIGWDKGKGLRFLLKPLVFIYDKLIFHQVRDLFGGRLKFFLGGGALLDIEFQKFFYAIGIPMFQGYGLTEASPIISSNTISRHKLGSSGYLVSNLQLKICDEKGQTLSTELKGEIVVKGDNVMKGYYTNEMATNATIRDGWLHTGDLGYIDKDGFLYVLGRFKSLLIADDGEKFSPEGMEEAFAGESAFIEQCMLYNNQNPYTVALVVTNSEALHRHLRQKGLKADSEEGQTEALKKIFECFQEYRSGGKYQSHFPHRWLPSAIAILDEQFTEENHQLNSLLKMVRGKITERHYSDIQFLYTSEARDFYNSRNREAIKDLLCSNKKHLDT